MNSWLVSAFVTRAGYPALVVKRQHVFGTWYCGYVGVPEDHPLHGKGEDEPLSILNGKSLEEVIEVFGGLTFSGVPTYRETTLALKTYRVDRSFWYFGFDTLHFIPGESTKVSLSFVQEECESLAEQLKRIEQEAAGCDH